MALFSLFDKPKAQPFDLEATLASWSDAPRFLGKKKQDPPVRAWLDQLEAGCTLRGVPDVQRVTVARALLGPKALARLEAFELVLLGMQGGGVYVWDWTRFRLAMESMGWEISGKKLSPFTVAAKRCGRWWVVGKKTETGASPPPSPPPSSITPAPSKITSEDDGSRSIAGTFRGAFSKGPAKDKEMDDFIVIASLSPAAVKEAEAASTAAASLPRKKPMRAMSDSLVSVFKPPPSGEGKLADGKLASGKAGNNKSSGSKNGDAKASDQDGGKSKETLKATTKSSAGPPVAPPGPKRAQTEPIAMTVANAPVWLVNASTALDFLTAEHPRACSALSAILLAVGSLPAIAASGGAAAPALVPALHAISSAGGAGIVAALGSHTAVAFGAVATGLGSWIKNQQEVRATIEAAPAPAQALVKAK